MSIQFDLKLRSIVSLKLMDFPQCSHWKATMGETTKQMHVISDINRSANNN